MKNQLFGHITDIMINEIYLTWHLLKSNLLAGFVPIIVFTMSAWIILDLDIESLHLNLLLASIFGFLYLYSFDITQQIISIPEDKINKPTRPLVTGEISKQNAIIRGIIIHVLFFVFGLIFDILIYVVMWQIASLLYKFSKYWVYKNFFITVGTISMLAGGWLLVGELPEEIFVWIVAIGVHLFFTVSLQDLRDVKGDMIMYRRTFPIVYGVKNTRYFLAVLYIVASPILNHFYFFSAGTNYATISLEIITSCLYIYIGWRILYRKTRKNNDMSYLLLIIIYLILLFSAIFIFEDLMI